MSKIDEPGAPFLVIEPRSRSLRLRLMGLAAVSIALTLTIAGLSFAYIFENHIERLIEQDLETRWLELAGAITLKADQPSLANELSDARYQRPGSGAYWRVTDHGVSKLRSRSLWDEDIEPVRFVHFSPTGKAVEQRGPGGSTVYMMDREVTVNGEAGPRMLHLAVALDTSAVSALRRSFAADVALALVLIGVVLFVGAWIQASIGLKPLKSLRNELALVNRGGRTQLAGRFPEEIAPLVEDLNRLLTRQEDLVRKARDRAGDLAHGLKTPLTILQSEARRAESRGELEIAVLLREQIGLMGRHIDRELSRARTFGASVAGGTLTDVRKTVGRLIDIIRRMPRGDMVAWENRVAEGLRLRMDPDDFGETVGNLIDNARKWAKSSVRVSTQVGHNDVSIFVDDDGPGVPHEMRALILRRGERATGAGEGAGLGLSIAMEILAQYGAALTIEESPSGGCRIRFAIAGWIDDKPQRAD